VPPELVATKTGERLENEYLILNAICPHDHIIQYREYGENAEISKDGIIVG
jgi:hypothetical protein